MTESPLTPVDMQAAIIAARAVFAGRGVTLRPPDPPIVLTPVLVLPSQPAVPDPPARRCWPHWTRNRVLDRIEEWNCRYGRPPASTEWNRALARQRGYDDVLAIIAAEPNYWPHIRTVTNLFGTWRAAIRAAGLQPPRRGRPPVDRVRLQPLGTRGTA